MSSQKQPSESQPLSNHLLTESLIQKRQPCFANLNSYSGICFSGEQTATFLQGQLTCDVRQLASEPALRTACCDNTGRVIATGYLFKYENDYIFWIPQSIYEHLFKHLSTFAPFSKVTLSPLPSDWITIGTLNLPTPSPRTNQEPNISFPLKSELRQTITLLPNTVAIEYCNQLTENNIIQINENDWELFNIIAKHPCITLDTTQQFLPQMLGFDKFNGISFDKGCYVGQEVIARTQHRGVLKRHLQQFTVETTSHITPGCVITDEQQNTLGIITNITKSTEAKYHGLAVIQDRGLKHTLAINQSPIIISTT